MTVLALGRTVLLVRIGTGNVVFNPNALKEGIEALVFPTPIRLHSFDFSICQAFNKFLEILKLSKNLRFMFKEIDPSELAKVIDETNIINFITNRIDSRTPYIGKHKLQRFNRNATGLRVG